MTVRFSGAKALSFAAIRCVIAVFALVFVGLFAPQASAQDFRFNTVAVEGNQRVATGTILTFAGISQGQALTAGELNTAAQNIRNSGLFESVDVVPQGGTLRITVVEYPTINRISVEGNSVLRDAELLAVVQSTPRRVYTPAQAEQDVAAITQVYANEGRINASVTPKIIRQSDNRVDLVFEVVESGVTENERISFIGNRNFSERRLRGVLETKQAGILRSVISRDTFVADRIAVDRQMLTDFYRSRGYADFQVLNVDVALTRERDAYLITFNIQEGQQFRFGNITVTSDLPDANAAEFQAALRTRSGATYNPVSIDTDIERLERLAVQKGLNFVQVEPRVTRNDRDLSLNVEFALIRGPRIFVERIDIEGNNTTLDRVVRNQFRTIEGDPFNPREIRNSAERIRALAYFSNADVQAREGSTPEQVIIDVNVVEAPTGSLSFGVNYNSDVGLGLIASYREANFLGRGQRLSFQLSTAQTNRVLSLSFEEPNFLGRDLAFNFDTSYRRTLNENALYDTETFRISPGITFPVSENGRLSLFYGLEYNDLKNVDVNASAVIKEEESSTGQWRNSIGYTYSFDTRRTGLDPNAGVLLRFGQEFGFGDTQYIETTAVAAAETKVLNEEVTLRATLEGGYLNYTKGFSSVTDRYFLGSRIMRGFQPGGIGPRDDATDDALGGNAYAVARLEAEFPLGLPEEYGIRGGAFIDYGSVWDIGRTAPAGTSVLYNSFTPRTIVGVAILWDTPVGPLRFNFTEALDVQTRDNPKSFDLTIQTNF
jgi:outer membrane protein insertion porin family